LLSTWENYTPTKPYFPIYKSTDHGSTWKEIAQVQVNLISSRTSLYRTDHKQDTVNGWGLRYQPFLYQLPQAMGGLPKGAILLAGNSIPTDLSKTQLDLYASTDAG
jgi:hypothetical protein